MAEKQKQFNKYYDCIFIWSRGGAGHKAVMDAKKQEWISKGSEDLLDLDIFGKEFLNRIKLPIMGRFGDFCVNFWNSAQEGGNIFTQKILINLQWFADILFYPAVYFKFKKILNEITHPPRQIIVTQPICNTAIARAIYKTNRKRGWNMHIDLWMSDLPTAKATHFFSSVKKISRFKKLSQLVTLYAPPPQLKAGEDHAEWWLENCGKVRVITDQPVPIRQAFIDQKSLIGKKVNLKLRSEEGEQQDIIVDKKDRVATLMLGSQPSKNAMLDYVDIVMKLAKEQKRKHKRRSDFHYYFFVFMGSNHDASLREAIEMRMNCPHCPDFLKIIPFVFQTDEELAPLLARSDVTLTRSGGSTAMELMHLNRDRKGVTLIHSEAYERKPKEASAKLGKGKVSINQKSVKITALFKKLTNFSEQVLMKKGIISWEAGNAEYLKKKIEAQIVTPVQIEQVLKSAFFEEEELASKQLVASGTSASYPLES